VICGSQTNTKSKGLETRLYNKLAWNKGEIDIGLDHKGFLDWRKNWFFGLWLLCQAPHSPLIFRC